MPKEQEDGAFLVVTFAQLIPEKIKFRIALATFIMLIGGVHS